MNDAITVGSKTSTGGEVISGNSGILVNNRFIALIGDIATCKCGSENCRGKGPIVATSPRNIVVDGRPFAKAGDLVDTGCGNCYLLPSSNQVVLGSNMETPLIVGNGVSIGNNVNINLGNDQPSVNTQSSALALNIPQQLQSTATKKSVQINPNNAYWPAINPYAKDGEKELHVEYINPIKSFAWLSPEEAYEFLKNLYADLGYKDTVSGMKDYGYGLGKGSYDAYKTAQGLGGLGVQAYTKNINGKDWIIIKNYRKHLKTLERGHKWGANNPRIIKLGLGLNDLKGAARYVRFNVGLEVAVSVGINAVDYALRDEATLSELVGNSAGDIVKGMISLVGAGVVAAFVPITIGVLGTTGVFVITSFSIGQALNVIDEDYGYTSKFTKAVQDYFK